MTVAEGLPADQLQVAREIVQIVRTRRDADELLDAMLIAITLEELDFVAWIFARHREEGWIPSQVHRLERLAYARDLAGRYLERRRCAQRMAAGEGKTTQPSGGV